MKRLTNKRIFFALIIFFVGLIGVILAVQFQTVKDLFLTIGSSGYIGALLAGILYASAFTSSAATVIFSKIPAYFNPFLVAIIAGIGSAIYDLTIFALTKNHTKHGFWEILRNRLTKKKKIPGWLSLTIGIFILGSPLPDELASTFLGFIGLNAKKFVIISFIANTLGILIILLIS